MLPCASSPRELRATVAAWAMVAPQAPTSAMSGLSFPSDISGRRFCRTLRTRSPGAGSPSPHTPTCPRPSLSMTKLARPTTRGLRTWLFTSNPPDPDAILKPPLKAASRSGRSAGLTDGPEEVPTLAPPDGGS